MMSIRRVLRTGIRRLGRRSSSGPKGSGKRPTNWFDLAVGARNG
jgi:hypothetical protein